MMYPSYYSIPYFYAAPYGYWGRAPQPALQGGPERLNERQPHADHVDWAGQFPNQVILHGPSVKEVALTFDDGPDEIWTPQILDDLREAGVKATFFLVGQRIEAHPDVFHRIIQEGHVVGNHSWDHPNLSNLSITALREQINKTDAVMNKLAGVTPHLLRPPYGALSTELIEEATRLNKIIILWNVDSLDWTQISDEQVAANILAHTGPGSIILQHSAGGVGQSLQNTVNALPYIIETLRSRGYQLRTVPEMQKVPAYNV
ncbi:MAG: polysaccharide deacetylase family protein [Candidatus Cohnella colombiensis]|uniref:Polysaccharide deacetylase family protein n=1 Tax=Candidatus Cohnella colombiensis TaxID=3121368 RepID=A0AA95JG76_9BACL|nr:MAG: polysaccharide deacetylase family protein [Cohnella sp.]